MSVSDAFELPEQPDSGVVSLNPLGGNGFTAPHSAYSITASLVHDASAGNASISVRFDPRYTQLLSYLEVQQISGAAAIDYFLEIQCTADDRVSVFKSAPLVAVVGYNVTNQLLWTPPPVLCSSGPGIVTSPPLFRFLTTNTDSETTTLRARIYNFDKRARELVPLPELLGSLQRGTNTD